MSHGSLFLSGIGVLGIGDWLDHGCHTVKTNLEAPSHQSLIPNPQSPHYSCEAPAGWSTRMPRLSPIVCRISLISLRLFLPKFFVFSISASVLFTSSRMVRMFAFFRQL